jgi:enediyne biosynthesis thioesterase
MSVSSDRSAAELEVKTVLPLVEDTGNSHTYIAPEPSEDVKALPFKMLRKARLTSSGSYAPIKEETIGLQQDFISNPELGKKIEVGHKTFTCLIEVYLKASNAYGNVYFSNYFDWQGTCREKWFKECLFPNMLAFQGLFITKNASIEFIQEVRPFETITATLNTRNIRNSSVELLINYYSSENNLLAKGSQLIVFADLQKRISRFPLYLSEKLREFQIN